MANGYIKAAQIIADDQTEVASKLQTLLDAEQVDSGEISNLEITTFGANKFLIAITYAALRSVGKWSIKVGLKLTGFSFKYIASKLLTTKAGLIATFIDSYKYYRKLVTLIGLKPSYSIALGTKLNSKMGLLASTFIWKFPSLYRQLTTGIGLLAATMEYTYHDKNLDSSLSTSSGLKVIWGAKYNGVPIEFD